MRFVNGSKRLASAALLACALAGAGCAGKADGKIGSEDDGAKAPTGKHDAGRDGSEDAGGELDGGDASVPPQGCTGGTVLPVTGDYVDESGTEHWLRKTASATTYTRVPGGAPVPTKPPTLWRVVETCPDQKTFVAVSENATYARVDWTTNAAGLHLCIAAGEMPDVAAAFAAPKSNVDALGAGCKGGPWTLLTIAKDGGK